MLTHNRQTPEKPKRVVLLGGSGFIGAEIANCLKSSGTNTLSISSSDIDLCKEGSSDTLIETLENGDVLIILSALTPDKGKGVDTFVKNIRMVENICNALSKTECAHVIYFSSDAVYPLESTNIDENTPAAPNDLYGIMHRSREIMLQSAVKCPLCILRPTLIYGANDTHSSYGPNRFRRQANKESKIVLGGEGEDIRDHVYVSDVAELTGLVVSHQSSGLLNIATGSSTDFGTVARLVAESSTREGELPDSVEITPTPRHNPPTERYFKTDHLKKAFPAFVFIPLEKGLALAQKEFE